VRDDRGVTSLSCHPYRSKLVKELRDDRSGDKSLLNLSQQEMSNLVKEVRDDISDAYFTEKHAHRSKLVKEVRVDRGDTSLS